MLGALSSDLIDALASHWGGAPRVFKNVLAEPLFSQKAFMEVLQATAMRVVGRQMKGMPLLSDDGRAPPLARAFLDAKLLESLTEAMPFIPQGGDTFPEYEARMKGAFPNREIAIILDNCESVYAPIRNNLCGSLHSLFSKVGYPARGNHACFYAGNYKKTPFKIHRDDAHILMFTGFGKKQMAFWPRGRVDERQLFAGQLTLSDALASEAIVCEIGPHDVLYWSPEYWHIGLSDGAEFHAALSLGIYHKGSAEEHFRGIDIWPKEGREKTNKLADYDKLNLDGLRWTPGPSSITAFPQTLLDEMRSKWETIRASMSQENELECQLLSKILAGVSSAGFGPIWRDQRVDASKLPADAQLACVDPELIAYSRLSNRIVVGGNGRAFSYSKSLQEIENALSSLRNKKRACLADVNEDVKSLLLDLVAERAIEVVH